MVYLKNPIFMRLANPAQLLHITTNHWIILTENTYLT
jgi:hypothetical protein